MSRRVPIAVAALTLMGGCADTRTRVAELRSGVPPAAPRAWHPGEYALVRTDGPNALVATAEVGRWERVGFRPEPGGAVVAVAGGRTFPVGDGEYEWARVADREPASALGEQAARDWFDLCGWRGWTVLGVGAAVVGYYALLLSGQLKGGVW